MTDKTELEVTAADDGKEYVIRKGGYFYRPKAEGYTSNANDAGRFSLKQAILHSFPNGPDGPRDGITYELATRTPDPTPVAWMPIESAPKDGCSVLVWREDWDEPVMARWVCCYDYLTDAEIEASGLDDESLGKCDWHAADYLQGCRLEDDTTPTHWQPLPLAPNHIEDMRGMVPPAVPDDGLVEALAELQLSAFLAGRGSVTGMNNGTRVAKPGPTMDDYRRMVTTALAAYRGEA